MTLKKDKKEIEEIMEHFKKFKDKPKGKEFVENLIGMYNRNVETFEEYLERLEGIFPVYNIPKEQHADILSSLTVKYKRHITFLADYKDLTYDELKHVLLIILNLDTAVKKSRLKFFNRKQLEDESISEYVAHLKNLAKDCQFEDDAFDDMIRDTFLNGVRSSEIMYEISKEKEASLDKIIRIAADLEKKKNVIENVLNRLTNVELRERNNPRKHSIQCHSIRSIDVRKDGCISDKLKVNLPGKETMIECIVELQWFRNNSDTPNAGILMIFQQSKENILWRVNVSEVTCILNRSEPGKPHCAVYTTEIIQDDGLAPLNVYFFDEEKLEDWFHSASKVLCQVNGSPEMSKNGSIWSTTVLGDIYVSDAESLQKNQSTLNGRFIKEYDCKQYENPFRIKLINGFRINTAITIHGKVHLNPNRFFVNLFCGFNKNIAFHFNPRYDQLEIVRNTYTEEAYWGPEEREGRFIIARGSNFTLTILCLDEKFKISVNGKTYTYYHHRVPYSTITDVEIGGDVDVSSILYESNKVIMHLPDLMWRKVQGNLWKVETCSAGITWGLDFNYFPFVFIGNSSQESNFMDVDLWRMVGSTKLRDLSLSVLDGTADSKIISLWAVSANGNVLYRSGVTIERIEGEKWIEVPTDQTIICIAISNRKQVWICGENGICYWRFGITATNLKGEAWRSVEPIDGRFFEKIAISKFTIWALDSRGDLFIRKETLPDVPASAEWHKIKNQGCKRFKHISANENDVWAICTAGMMYRRVGMSEENPEGVSWNCGSLPGNFLHISQ